uniref:F-box domain-containing protein n=1 Tax=Leersia perrieri TaxID=77586 RepID=A0A0D9WQU8_9ORYZ
MENLLPEDVLVNILHRLAPRCLAISRCVCKPWRTIIDAHCLLRVDLLPHLVGGIFINFHDLILSEFISRPSIGPTISGNFNYLPHNSIVRDHCNGLLLLDGYVDYPATQQYYVVNPATRQWVQLPPCPSSHPGMYNESKEYLVFDPRLSSQFEVFVIPYACVMPYASVLHRNVQLDPMIEEIEWPPSPCILHVFSSRTKQWEERSFVREGEAAGTLSKIRPNCPHFLQNAVYWRGVLYVRCQTNDVMRISLSGKYQLIKPPQSPLDIGDMDYSNIYLGRSQKGIYCTFVDNPYRVYILDESYGKMEWVPKHTICYVPRQEFRQIGPSTLQDINFYEYIGHYEYDNSEAIDEQKFEWDSDNDNSSILTIGEVVFLSHTLNRGLAYHLNTRKPFIEGSFPYTPWLGEFPEDG